ncbi:unnamed protein product [Fraxinus pennsylvanica]|uniref:Uncharacterized protein n=1 Tax=Fraxinus pennsylvanica TaxID=56036 RepID=A0AAD2DHH2_9LAMI|nr:unnamed protein product [Fraxinus pennsylvanica]
MLSNGKDRFDIVMANIYSPDTSTFKILQAAVKMDLLVILMCDHDDDMMARSALEQGAFLFLQKPVKMENVKYLWQHVWRKKIWRLKEHGDVTAFNRTSNGFGTEEEIPLENVTSDDNDVFENGRKSRKKVKTKKVWTEWNQELHDKFLDAVIQLGEGRCYPKDILQLMNVPGLTRMQVASHLQKCRSGNWKPCEWRKRHYSDVVASPEIEANKSKRKRFGSMPILTEHFEQQHLQSEENSEKIHPQTYDSTNNKVFDYNPQLPEVKSKKDSSRYTFAQDNVAAPYIEQVGSNLQAVPGAFMSNEPFLFGFNSVTSGNLQAFDIDQPNEPG